MNDAAQRRLPIQAAPIDRGLGFGGASSAAGIEPSQNNLGQVLGQVLPQVLPYVLSLF